MYRAKAAGGDRFGAADAEADARAITRHALTNALPGGAGTRRVLPRVPAAGAAARRQRARGRGAGALAAPAARRARPGPLHPARRGDRADRAARPLGAGRGRAARPRSWQRQSRRPALRSTSTSRRRQLHDPGLVADVAVDPGARPACRRTLLYLEVTESALIGDDDEPAGRAAPARRRRRPARDRRLRHRLLQPGQPAPAAGRVLKLAGSSPERCSPPTRSTTRSSRRSSSLAHSLELAVTVEGVETGAQADQLRALGCDTAQGWYYARPGSGADIAHRMTVM